MRHRVMVSVLTCVWGFAACDAPPTGTTSGPPALVTLASEGTPPEAADHGQIQAAIECLEACAKRVDKLEPVNSPKQGDARADQVERRQEQCSDRLARLSEEARAEVLARAADAYAACFPTDPCADACGEMVRALDQQCRQLGLPELCDLILASEPYCVAAVCPIDADTCADDCRAYGQAAAELCGTTIPDAPYCGLLFPIFSQSCMSLCPPPPPTCEQLCSDAATTELEPCYASGDPACFLGVEASARTCFGGCCEGQCDAKRDAQLPECEAEDAPPDCTEQILGDHASCVTGCDLPPSACDNLICEWFEDAYCPQDCVGPEVCWDQCWQQFEGDWQACDSAPDPFACREDADFDRSFCDWECCSSQCGGGDCCGPPPVKPECGNGLCEGNELSTCPEDCPAQVCQQSCDETYITTMDQCFMQPEPGQCVDAAQNAYALCATGCCELQCGEPGCCGEPYLVTCGDGRCDGFEPDYCVSDCPAQACYRSCDLSRQEGAAACEPLVGSPDYYLCMQDVDNASNLCWHGCCELECGQPGCCGDPPPPNVCGDGICGGLEPSFCEVDCPGEFCRQSCWQAYDAAVQACWSEPDPTPCLMAADYDMMLCDFGCCEAECGTPGCCGEPPPRPTYCGDGLCDASENGWCPDCPAVCGDGYCQPGEEASCDADCYYVCGDGVCAPAEQGWCEDCPFCGDGVCTPDEAGWCPDCGTVCGDGVCNHGEEGWCPDCGPICGDGLCDPGEDGWCPDCGAFCGDGVCTPDEEGWCPDCGAFCGDGVCTPDEEGWCPDCSICGDGLCAPDEMGWCPDCGMACGDGVCTPDEVGVCADCDPTCGDGLCEPHEVGRCFDCPDTCGNGVCDPGEEGWCAECP